MEDPQDEKRIDHNYQETTGVVTGNLAGMSARLRGPIVCPLLRSVQCRYILRLEQDCLDQWFLSF